MAITVPRASLFAALVPLLMSGARTLPSAYGSLTGHVPHPVREGGRIVGTVEISEALTARRPRFRIYADAGPGAVPPARPRNELAAELRNVVVFLQADRASVLEPADTARRDSTRIAAMAQIDERFDPHVIPVVEGGRVEFPNRDGIYHNVFSLSSARTFDLGRYPKGSSKSVVFPKPGIVQVFCHIHSDMSGIVLVLTNPFFAAPDSSGRYALDDLPPGDYTIVGWHERTKPARRRVRVVAGQTTTLNFSLPLGPGAEP